MLRVSICCFFLLSFGSFAVKAHHFLLAHLAAQHTCSKASVKRYQSSPIQTCYQIQLINCCLWASWLSPRETWLQQDKNRYTKERNQRGLLCDSVCVIESRTSFSTRCSASVFERVRVSQHLDILYLLPWLDLISMGGMCHFFWVFFFPATGAKEEWKLRCKRKWTCCICTPPNICVTSVLGTWLLYMISLVQV